MYTYKKILNGMLLCLPTLPIGTRNFWICKDVNKIRTRESESIATLPPFGPIEGHKRFFQISSQWESQKNRFAFISYDKIQFFLPPSIWDLPFMSYRLWNRGHCIFYEIRQYACSIEYNRTTLPELLVLGTWRKRRNIWFNIPFFLIFY
jgi:hypothetical protein